mgnify:CR=1 FL=1
MYFRSIKRIFCIGLFVFFCNQKLQADNLFFRVWKQYVINYASQKLPNVSKLSEQEKVIFFKEDAKKTVAILLYEFAMPNGIVQRDFDTSHAISKDLMQTTGFKYVMKKYINRQKDSLTLTEDSFRFIMTPRKDINGKAILFQMPEAIGQHVRWFTKPKISQLFLGSYVCKITPINEHWVAVSIFNITGRNSLFMHIPKNVDKPELFGTISQQFSLLVKVDSFK